MPVKIRLMRMGKAKQPSYRVVVADGRSPRDGRFLEILGTYAPRQEPSAVDIDADRAVAWLHQGAQPTETAHRLLALTGIWERYETERGKPAKAPKPPPSGPGGPEKRSAAEPAAQASDGPEAAGTEAGDASPAASHPGGDESADEVGDA